MRVSEWSRRVRTRKIRLACLIGALVFGAAFLIRGALTLIAGSQQREASVRDSGILTYITITPVLKDEEDVRQPLTIRVYDTRRRHAGDARLTTTSTTAERGGARRLSRGGAQAQAVAIRTTPSPSLPPTAEAAAHVPPGRTYARIPPIVRPSLPTRS
jgi:hypothetical protein